MGVLVVVVTMMVMMMKNILSHPHLILEHLDDGDVDGRNADVELLSILQLQDDVDEAQMRAPMQSPIPLQRFVTRRELLHRLKGEKRWVSALWARTAKNTD